MDRTQINGQDLIALVKGGAACLRENESIVNDLNVFPIPDGDTGANMLLTIEGGAKSVKDNTEMAIGPVAAKIASGMLLSARGNSGVILSQLFAGFANGLDGKATANAEDVVRALRKGVETGYGAVVNPTEGTILTVAREAYEYAGSKVTADSTVESLAADYFEEAAQSLQRTPDLLAVLKEAGVVDSGGAGLYYIVQGALNVLRGRTPMSIDFASSSSEASKELDFSKFNEDSVMQFGYCTEFLLQLQKCKCDIDAFTVEKDMIPYLESMGGDSIVCFKNGSVVKVHVHTMTPSKALEYAQKFGEFLKVKIENMTLQHSETVIRNRFHVDIPKAKRKKFAMVVVATGEGVKKTFKDLGADYIIDGGQGRNPSSEDFITAFSTVNADTIFVLPNNGNIVLAARQAAGLYDASDIHVIESKDIGEGYAAMTMLSYDSNDAKQIEEELKEAMNGVVTCMVTTSVRDASLNGIAISMHDYIGFTKKTMLAADKSKTNCALTLLKNIKAKDHEYIIVIYGKDATAGDKKELRERVSREYPAIEIYEIDGGQEIYDFMFILQ